MKEEMRVRQWGRWAAAAALALAMAPAVAHADKASGTLVVGMQREADFIDRLTTDSRESGFFSNLLYDSLLYMDPQTAKLEGNLATAWRWVDDKTVEFDLRPNVKFSDGSAFSADDVVYTVNYAANPDNKLRQQSSDFGNLASAEKTGPLQVRVHLKAPDPKAEFVFAGRLIIWPKAYTEANGPAIHGTKPVGTGHYKLEKMERGKEYILVANPDAHDGPVPKPSIARIDAKVIPEIQTQIAELMAGGIDFSEDIPPDNAAMLAANPAVKVEYGKTSRYVFLMLDAAGRSGEGPMKNQAARQAIAAAIDKQSIATKLIGNGATALVAQCNPIQNLCVQNVTPQTYDPAKAKALMAQAGIAPGTTIPMISAAELRPVGEAIQGQLAQVGIKLDYQTFPLPAWRDKLFRNESVISLLGWGGSNFDVDQAIHLFYDGSNTDYARDTELTGWVNQAASTVDKPARTALYEKILGRINERAYAVPLYEQGAVYAMSAGLDFAAPNTGVPDLNWAKWH